jgi:hypothetical protein
MRRMKLAMAALVLLIANSGCGAIFNGTRQTITATSAPDAAMVSASPGNFQYTTPASFDLERKNEYLLTFTKEGYSPATFQTKKSLQGGIVVLDVLFTGLIGVIVDAATGAWFKLSPEAATVAMTRLNASIDGPETIEVSIIPSRGKVRVEASEPGVAITVQAQ